MIYFRGKKQRNGKFGNRGRKRRGLVCITLFVLSYLVSLICGSSQHQVLEFPHNHSGHSIQSNSVCTSSCLVRDDIQPNSVRGTASSDPMFYYEDAIQISSCHYLEKVFAYGNDRIKYIKFKFKNKNDSSDTLYIAFGDSSFEDTEFQSSVAFSSDIVKWGICQSATYIELMHFCTASDTNSASVGISQNTVNCPSSVVCDNNPYLESIPNSQRLIGFGVYYKEDTAVASFDGIYQIRSIVEKDPPCCGTCCGTILSINSFLTSPITRNLYDLQNDYGINASSTIAGCSPFTYSFTSNDFKIELIPSTSVIRFYEVTEDLVQNNLGSNPQTYQLTVTTADEKASQTFEINLTIACSTNFGLSWATPPPSYPTVTTFQIGQDTIPKAIPFDIDAGVCNGLLQETFALIPPRPYLQLDSSNQVIYLEGHDLSEVTAGSDSITLRASVTGLQTETLDFVFYVQVKHPCHLTSIQLQALNFMDVLVQSGADSQQWIYAENSYDPPEDCGIIEYSYEPMDSNDNFPFSSTHFEIRSDGLISIRSLQPSDVTTLSPNPFTLKIITKMRDYPEITASTQLIFQMRCEVFSLSFNSAVPSFQYQIKRSGTFIHELLLTQVPSCNEDIQFTITPNGFDWMTIVDNYKLQIFSDNVQHHTDGPITFTIVASQATSLITTAAMFNVDMIDTCRTVDLSFPETGHFLETKVLDPDRPFIRTIEAHDGESDETGIENFCGQYTYNYIPANQGETFAFAGTKFQLSGYTMSFYSDEVSDVQTLSPNPFELTIVLSLENYPDRSFSRNIYVEVICRVFDFNFNPGSFLPIAQDFWIFLDDFSQSVSLTQYPACAEQVQYAITPPKQYLVVIDDVSGPIFKIDPVSLTDESHGINIQHQLEASLQISNKVAIQSFQINMKNPCRQWNQLTTHKIQSSVFFKDGHLSDSFVPFTMWTHMYSTGYPLIDCGPFDFKVLQDPPVGMGMQIDTWTSVNQQNETIHLNLDWVYPSLDTQYILNGYLVDYPDEMVANVTFDVQVYYFGCNVLTKPDPVEKIIVVYQSEPEEDEEAEEFEPFEVLMETIAYPFNNLNQTQNVTVTRQGEPFENYTQIFEFVGDNNPDNNVNRRKFLFYEPSPEFEDTYQVSFAQYLTDFPERQPYYCNFTVKLKCSPPPPKEISNENPAFYFDAADKVPQLECGQALDYRIPTVLKIDGTNQTNYKVSMSTSLRIVRLVDDVLSIKEGDIEFKHGGIQTVKLKVTDELGKTSTTNIQVVINCMSYKERNKVGQIISQNPPKPYIEKIDNRGMVWVRFGRKLTIPNQLIQNQYLKGNDAGSLKKRILEEVIEGHRNEVFEDYAFINQGNLVVNDTILPTISIGISQGDQEAQYLDFKWKLVNFTSDLMVFQLLFVYPEWIASSTQPNYLVIKIIAQDLFIDFENQYIRPDYEMKKMIPPQINPETADTIEIVKETAASATKGVFLSNVVVNLLFQGSMSELLSTISAFQILAHNTLINVNVPTNAQLVYSFLLTIVAFDIFDTQDLMTDLFSLPPSEAFTNNFEQLGYETSYFTINIGSILIICAAQPFILILSHFMEKECDCCPKIRRWFVSVKRNMLFNGILALLDKIYLIMTICSILAIRLVLEKQIPLTGDFFIASLFGLLIVFFPIWVCKILIQGREQLHEKKFKQTYGYIYDGLDYKRRGIKILTHPIMNIGRFVILAITVCLVDRFQFQLMILNFIQVFVIIMLGQWQNFKQKQGNNKLITDEYLILLIVYHLFCSTDLVIDTPTKVWVGWSMIVFTGFILALRLGGLFMQPISLAIQRLKYWYKRKQNIKLFLEKRKLLSKLKVQVPEVTRQLAELKTLKDLEDVQKEIKLIKQSEMTSMVQQNQRDKENQIKLNALFQDDFKNDVNYQDLMFMNQLQLLGQDNGEKAIDILLNKEIETKNIKNSHNLPYIESQQESQKASMPKKSYRENKGSLSGICQSSSSSESDEDAKNTRMKSKRGLKKKNKKSRSKSHKKKKIVKVQSKNLIPIKVKGTKSVKMKIPTQIAPIQLTQPEQNLPKHRLTLEEINARADSILEDPQYNKSLLKQQLQQEDDILNFLPYNNNQSLERRNKYQQEIQKETALGIQTSNNYSASELLNSRLQGLKPTTYQAPYNYANFSEASQYLNQQPEDSRNSQRNALFGTNAILTGESVSSQQHDSSHQTSSPCVKTLNLMGQSPSMIRQQQELQSGTTLLPTSIAMRRADRRTRILSFENNNTTSSYPCLLLEQQFTKQPDRDIDLNIQNQQRRSNQSNMSLNGQKLQHHVRNSGVIPLQETPKNRQKQRGNPVSIDTANSIILGTHKPQLSNIPSPYGL